MVYVFLLLCVACECAETLLFAGNHVAAAAALLLLLFVLSGLKCETRNGSLVVTTNNTEVEFLYYDTPHKKFKPMKKTYVSGMLQVRTRRGGARLV